MSTLSSWIVMAMALLVIQDELRICDTATKTVKVSPGTELGAIELCETLTSELTIEGGPIVLRRGAVVRYAANGNVANQAIDCTLQLQGDATFINDNGWTHEAHMLRIGEIHGSGRIRIEGRGDGGVELRADGRGSFLGPIDVVSGRLIVRHDGSLGDVAQPTILRGGDCFVCGGVTLDEPFRVVGDARVSTGGENTLRGDLDIAAGSTLTFDTGGGNVSVITGQWRGEGALVWIGGGGTPATQAAASRLAGDQPTTLTGTVTLRRGTLALAKPEGVSAIAGPLVLGGGSNRATLRLDASHQIEDRVPIRLIGPEPVAIRTQGHDEALGALTVQTAATLDLGGHGQVIFSDSRGGDWSRGTLIIEGWSQDASIRFLGLRDVQLAHIGFRDSAGLEPGLHRARWGERGEVVPAEPVRERAGNAFSISKAARDGRRRIYEIPGRARLASEVTRLRDGDRLSFFGDSITWQHGFLGRIDSALREGPGTRSMSIHLSNRGINGGGVRDLRDGSTRSARVGGRGDGGGDAPQAAFEEVLREDQPRVVIVFIGINDVTWRGTTLEEFDEALRSLVQAARRHGALVVLATPALANERPDGSNRHDRRIEAFAGITRTVAASTGATLVDARRACVAYLQNENARLQLDGSLRFDDVGHLTYDGIHPSDRGNELLADLLCDGIARALAGE